MKIDYSSFPKVLLSDLVEINIGKTPSRSIPQYFGKGETWLSIRDMNGQKFLSISKEEITDLGIKESKIKVVKKGTLLFSFKLSIGKVAIADKDLFTNEAIASFPIIDQNKLDINYLYQVMKSFDFTDGGVRAVKGKTLNKTKLKKIKIPLPTLFVQKQIASILDQADRMVQLNKDLIGKYDDFAKSIFLDMFGDPILNPHKWKTETVENVCLKIYGGGTPTKSNKDFYKGEIPWVTPKDMKRLYINDSQDKITEDAILKSSAKLIPENSILMVIRSGILKKTLPVALNLKEVALNQDMKAYIPDKNKLKPNYFLYFFLIGQKYLLNKVRAVTADNIEFKQIKQLDVPLPNIQLQNSFEAKIENINKQRSLAKKQFFKSQDLYQSLIQKAFKGELIKSEQHETA